MNENIQHEDESEKVLVAVRLKQTLSDNELPEEPEKEEEVVGWIQRRWYVY